MNIEVRGLADLGTDARRALSERDTSVGEVQSDVRDIAECVCREGDVAVREFSNEFDGIQVGNIDVTDVAEHAYDRIDDSAREAIEAAAANTRELHEKQIPEDWYEEFSDVGTRELGRRCRPLDRIDAYVPGGIAVYPSSVLMGATPAKVAGVEHVVVATPPAESMNPVTLAVMHVAGMDTVYSVDGTQGTAALVYGTETVRAVQKVVGPGNRWVIAARAKVRGDVDIDFLTGPSEVLVVADETAEAWFVAADLIAQTEYDSNASVVAVTDDADLAAEIVAEIERQTDERERVETIEAALGDDASGVLLTWLMSEAMLSAEEYVAEHLTTQADDDETLLDRTDPTGGTFLGLYTPVAAGDYASGTNCVLPTDGGAKQQGGLSMDRFARPAAVRHLDRDGLSEPPETVMTLVEAEGLDAHTQSVRGQFEE